MQDVDGVVERALRKLGLPDDTARIGADRLALCPPPDGHLALFPGAIELLSRIKALGILCIAVSNAGFRDRHAYRRDFEAAGIGAHLDIVPSVGVGFRWPLCATFDAALVLAGCPPERCAMTGNSEPMDVRPALLLRMRKILVRATEPRPSARNAHAALGAPHEAADVVGRWTPPNVG